MKFSALTRPTSGKPFAENEFEIGSLTDDTRALAGAENEVYVWDSRIAPGGEKFIADAQAKGARTISDLPAADLVIPDPGLLLSRYAEALSPGQPEVCVGVTGTSGKTSVAWFAQSLAAAAGLQAASLGTLGVVRNNTIGEYTGYTSPSALKAHPLLQKLKQQGVQLAALEVSSHALALNRLDGVRFAAAGFTNISQDHLDFHGDLETYFQAKVRLFTEVLPEGAAAVINTNRPELLPVASFAKQRGLRVISSGTRNAEVVVSVLAAHARGIDVEFKIDAVPVAATLPLVGSFQAENVAVALGLLLGAGLRWDDLKKNIVTAISGVPGRMEIVESAPHQPTVVVDYAHKPDALEKALAALRPQVVPGRKLVVVFGCGGNRDAAKRPLMGGIAARLADEVIVTDDNPRKEDPADVRAAVLAGAGGIGGKVKEIGDRREAIAAAIENARAGDIVLVAGKGHEDGQIVGDVTLPFDDRTVVAEILKGR